MRTIYIYITNTINFALVTILEITQSLKYSVNCIFDIYYMKPEHSYILPMDASVTTVSKFGTTVKSPVMCYCIQNVEMYIVDIDIVLIPNQYFGNF